YASASGDSRHPGRCARHVLRRVGPDHQYPGRRVAARQGWCPGGSAWSLDLLRRRSEVAGVAVFGKLDGVAVPAGPVASIDDLPAHLPIITWRLSRRHPWMAPAAGVTVSGSSSAAERVPSGAVTVGQADGPGLAARTQATGGLRGRVWVLRCVRPAPRSRSSISRAALRDVSAVAPGQRGWDAMAMRPPGASRRRSSASRSAWAGQNPRALMAMLASHGP